MAVCVPPAELLDAADRKCFFNKALKSKRGDKQGKDN
jgi:hypothetical protein